MQPLSKHTVGHPREQPLKCPDQQKTNRHKTANRSQLYTSYTKLLGIN